MLDVWLVVLPMREIKASNSDQGYDRDWKLGSLRCSLQGFTRKVQEAESR
jgi:hypothetical protein